MSSILAVRPVAAQPASGPEDASVQEPAARVYRVSALIQGARGYLVGFVDAANAQSFYVPEHGTGRGITVEQVDYEGERIVLSIGGETRELYLADAPESRLVQVQATAADEPYLDPGPDDPADEVPEVTPGPSDGLKAMMAQFPDAVPTNFLNQPNAIQAYLEQHPELAEKMNPPASRFGPGIEAMMKLYPALSNQVEQAAAP